MKLCPTCAPFSLSTDWRKLLRQAHSIRWTVASGFLIGAEGVLPLFQDTIPRGYFASASMLAAIGSVLARVKDQPEMHDGH